ncbi:MAG: hypothetical protein GQ574_12370 [Crocinitomix sp.]|nr:hypothetical protein [Crocinitomix sp.]
MKEAKFIEKKKDSYFEYHLPCGDGLLDNSILYKTSKLTKKLQMKWNQYLWDSGITDLGSDENSLIYALILKVLSQEKEVNMLTSKNNFGLEKHLNLTDLKDVEWKFSFEFTKYDNELCRQFGYQTLKEFLDEMNYSNRDPSNRGFQISKLSSEKIDSFIKTYNSDVTSWSFIINFDWSKLTETLLNANKRPQTTEILQYSDCVINVQIGGDEGYLDYVLIQSKTELKNAIEKLEKVINYFGNQLDNLISQVGIIDDEWKIDFFQTQFEEIKKVAIGM